MKSKLLWLLIMSVLICIFYNYKENFLSMSQYGVPMKKTTLLNIFNINQLHHDNEWIKE